MSDIIKAAKTRYATKSYSDKKISDADMAKVKELLQLSASSVNGQPWHFVIAGTEEGKARVAKSAEKFPFNIGTITNASHVVVFASRLVLDEEYLLRLLEQEDADGRFAAGASFKEQMHGGRSMFAQLNEPNQGEWNARQTYLNLGAFLLGISTLGLDATPMEGVDVAALDEEFGLKDKGYQALAAVAIGYHADEDFNARLPKSRLPQSEIITEV